MQEKHNLLYRNHISLIHENHLHPPCFCLHQRPQNSGKKGHKCKKRAEIQKTGRNAKKGRKCMFNLKKGIDKRVKMHFQFRNTKK